MQRGANQVSSVRGQWSSGIYQVMINLKLKNTKVFGVDNGGFVSEYGSRGRRVDDCLESAFKHVVDGTYRPVVLSERRISVGFWVGFVGCVILDLRESKILVFAVLNF